MHYLVMVIFLAATAASGAPANVRGWYEVGPSVIEDAELDAFLNEPVSGNKVEFDPGVRGAIGFGYELTRQVALEVEGGFHYNSISSVAGASADRADLYQVPVLGNISLHFPNRTRFVPVLGAGVGAVFSILDADNISLGSTTFSSSEETWSFAYQGYAGLAYHFRPDMALGFTYRYLRNEGPNWDNDSGNDIEFNRLVNHSLALTFTFRF